MQEQLDRLVTFVSEPRFQAELAAAKKIYFELTGEVFENDEVFENRMASFLEWFIFDRALASGSTPVQTFVQEREAELNAEERIVFRNFAHTVHGLFEVTKIKPEALHVKDLLSGAAAVVFERRKPVAIDSGDIFEGRLIPTADNQLRFSTCFNFHPRAAKKAILRMVKEHKKAGGDPAALIHRLAYLRLKVDRYKHLAPEKLYE